MLIWTRVDAYHERADTGHRVAAAKRPDGSWAFVASGPDVAPGVRYNEWPPIAESQVTYPRGTPVPQRHESLGIYDAAADARAACEAHAQRVQQGGA